MVLSLAQRVGGKEIEALRFEGADVLAAEAEQIAADLSALRMLLHHHETVVADMEATLKQIDSQIAALCQA